MGHILVTGSSRGIGKAALAALAARGVPVIGHASRAPAAAPDASASPVIIAADFGDPLAAQALWDQALDLAGGAIDVVVNNAGRFEANRLERSDIEWLDAWEDTLRVNLTAAAQLSRFAVQHWQARGPNGNGIAGRLVHVASRAAYRGDSPAHWHYAAAKGGMVAMHKTIARAYAKDGILSFAVTPGFTDTDMAGDYLASRGGPGLLADIPLGRVATPEEIASIIAFCALDAPPSMTGAVIDANGASFVR
jgi:NAD(P)-dependent dehydrogenase (short-subunit alcohol dehydrogenase family)